MKDVEYKYTKAKEEQKCNKELVKKLQKDQGLPEESVVVAAENMLKSIGASREANHKGDYIGVSCHWITANTCEIAEPLKCIPYHGKMKDDCMKEMINKTVHYILI